jgi:4-amino-4-deoxy-L-arabinose transferase-like glycosyltransferase
LLTALGLVLALATGLRVFHLGERVLWFDESLSILIARADIADAVTAAADEKLPPLYNVALHFWTRMAPGEEGARWLSVLLGVAAVAAVFALGNALAGRTTGLLAALFLALCPLHVWYSQEIRMYALQTLLVCLSFLFMFRALERPKTTWWMLYVVATTLSLYAQYTSFLALVAQNIYIIASARRHKESLRRWVLAQAVVALLFAPWLVELLHHLASRTQAFWIKPLTWDMPIRFFALLSGSNLTDTSARWPEIGISLLLLTVALAVLFRDKETRPRALLLTLWFFMPLALLVLASLGQNLFLPRVILYIAPAFALLVGWGMAREFTPTASGRVIAIAGIGTLMAFNLFALQGYYFNDNWWVKSPLREASAKVAGEFRHGDIVIHSSRFSYRPFQYYAGDRIAQGLLVETENFPGLFRVIGDSRLPKDTAPFRRIWLVLYPDFQQPGLHQRVLDWMNKHHTLSRVVYDSRTLHVALYDRRDAALTPPGVISPR